MARRNGACHRARRYCAFRSAQKPRKAGSAMTCLALTATGAHLSLGPQQLRDMLARLLDQGVRVSKQ
jgi:hypothetical protein